METTEVIAVSVALLNQAARAIALANEGDAERAEKALRDARDHFDASVAAWDNA